MDKKPKEKKIYIDLDNISSTIKNLTNFESNLKSLKKVNSVLSIDNLNFFSTLISKENIKINLILSHIFGIIISNEYLYKDYIPSIKENEYRKLDILLGFIDICGSVIESLNNFIFSAELFDLKKKSLALLNYLYNNFQDKLKDDNERLNKIIELINTLPSKYYSESFNEMCKSRETFEIYKSQNSYSITKFEDMFSEINNCFEQNEIFKKFIELNSDLKLLQKDTEIEVIEIKQDNEVDLDLIDFYEKYGLLLIKFCAYHYYIFLDKKEEEEVKDKEEKEEEKIEEEMEENAEDEGTKVIFLINKSTKEKKNEEIKDVSQKNKRVEDLLRDKRFKSSLDSKEYKDLIKKGIIFYLTAIKNIENFPKIKIIKNHLAYFLESLETESYYPLYLKNLDKMMINDNFTQSFVTSVSPGEINKFYFETNFKKDTLVYIEFYLEDKTKDINFELNQYDNNHNIFKPIFMQEKVDETLRFYLYCRGYSVYEIVFDNYYSWFNSKDINFRVSYLLPIFDEENEQLYDNEDYFVIDGGRFYYKHSEKSEDDLFDVPIIVNLNNLKTVNMKKSDELEFKENKEEDDIISKLYLNYILFNQFKKQKLDKNPELVVSIFSQNKNLLKIKQDLEEQIKNCKNNDEKKFLKILGFIPDEKINGIKIKYRLYDLNEQLIIYHKYLKFEKNKEKKEKEKEKDNNENEIINEKEDKDNKIELKDNQEKDKKDIKEKDKDEIKYILLIHLNKLSVNITLFNKGEFHSKLKISDSKEINFEDIEFNKEEEIFNFIKKVAENIKGLELIITYDINLKEEDKKRSKDLIELLIKYCQEIINPPISAFEYDINEIYKIIIKYIYSLN